MAELDVQPKKNNSIQWIILTIIIIGLGFLISRGCNNGQTPVTSGADSSVVDTVNKK